MPSSHLILCCPLLLLPTVPPSIRVFSKESTIHMRWPKYWSFSFSISTSNEYSGLISFKMVWLDLLAVQGTLKSLLQHHSSKQEDIILNTRLDEAKAGIRIAGRNINNLLYADNTTLMAESKEELKSLLMKVKEIEKAGLKLSIQKMKIIASSSIISWQIDGKTVETVTGLSFLGSKITADGDCSHEIKKCLLLGRKTMANLDSILKRRDITLLTEFLYS